MRQAISSSRQCLHDSKKGLWGNLAARQAPDLQVWVQIPVTPLRNYAYTASQTKANEKKHKKAFL